MNSALRKYVLLLVVGLCATARLFAQTDTLQSYEKGTTQVPFAIKGALWYMARFDLQAPGHLKSVRVMLDGEGSGKLRLFGHEGGSPYAELEKDLIEAVSFEKKGAEPDFITIDLPQDVWLDNNQFFVVLDLSESELRPMRCGVRQKPHCASPDGGTFAPTVVAMPGPVSYYNHHWQLLDYPLVVQAIFDIPEHNSRNYFIDVTEAKGLPLDMPMKTVAWGDYNGDGYLDLLVAGRLFKNNGTAKNFTETSEDVGLKGGAYGNAFVDLNNDGWLDILLFASDNVAFMNRGDGTFSVFPLDLPTFSSMSSFSIGDVNGDGYADLFVGQLWSTYPIPQTNYLFLNDQNLGFVDATRNIYPQYDGNTNYPNNTACDPNNSSTFLSNGNRARRSRGSQFVDFDNDGDLDLFVTNYFLETDEFYANNGNGTFTDISAQKGIDISASGSNHGTGVDWYDYDNDGDLDLLLSNFAHPWGVKSFGHEGTGIYRNEGPPNYNFTNLYGKTGIMYEETQAGGAFGDMDNDGLADLALTTYYGCRYIELYKQDRNHKFSSRTYQYGLENIVTGEDVNWVDFDNDGRLDLCLGNNGRFRLYKNNVDCYDHRWVAFDLKSASSAVGAQVVVETKSDTFTQQLSCGHGQKMQQPARLHFGLGKGAAIKRVSVKWPDGNTVNFDDLQTNSLYTITPKGQAILSVASATEADDMQYFPNPCSGELQLLNVQEVVITNLQGLEVLHLNTQNKPAIETKNLPRGFYIIQLYNGNKYRVGSLLIR
ncbi:T9SS type A sorting domain-containing protein [bacterium]|nr:T9SS type A sorting domain-containing protein [bacterium]